MTGPIQGGSASPPLPAGNSTVPARQAPVVDRRRVDPETLKAAQGMERMFVDYMLQVMRQTVPENEMDLESPATKIYRGMLDSEYAEKAVKAGGVGLADQIVAYLEARRYTGSRGGSRNESQSNKQSDGRER